MRSRSRGERAIGSALISGDHCDGLQPRCFFPSVHVTTIAMVFGAHVFRDRDYQVLREHQVACYDDVAHFYASIRPVHMLVDVWEVQASLR